MAAIKVGLPTAAAEVTVRPGLPSESNEKGTRTRWTFELLLLRADTKKEACLGTASPWLDSLA